MQGFRLAGLGGPAASTFIPAYPHTVADVFPSVAGVSLPEVGLHRARRLVRGKTAMLTDAANLDLVYPGFQKLCSDAFLAAPACSDNIALKVASTGASEQSSRLGALRATRERVGLRVSRNHDVNSFAISDRMFAIARSQSSGHNCPFTIVRSQSARFDLKLTLEPGGQTRFDQEGTRRSHWPKPPVAFFHGQPQVADFARCFPARRCPG